MPLVKNYRTYPITRSPSGEFYVIAGPTLADYRGPFDTTAEAEAWVNETIEGITKRLDIPPHPAAGKQKEKTNG